jgi:hypothetical protein
MYSARTDSFKRMLDGTGDESQFCADRGLVDAQVLGAPTYVARRFVVSRLI